MATIENTQALTPQQMAALNTTGTGIGSLAPTGPTPITQQPSSAIVPQAPAAVPAAPVTTPSTTQQPATPTQPVTVNVNTPQAPANDYTVKSGDTLSGIAAKQGTTLADILASNPQYQQNPNLIRPGQIVNLSKKYQDFHQSMGQTTAPDTNPRQQIQEQVQQADTQSDPQKLFQDALSQMNPVERMLYDQISAALSTQNTQQTFTEQWKALENDPALVGMKTDLMNINNIMNGTEDDIRDEIVKAGGTGTESQIAAMTGARNKTLLKQSKVLSDAIQQKEDYISKIMQLTQADRAEVDKQVTQKLGLTTQIADMIDKQSTAAKGNYQKIVDTVGYQGLADGLDTNGKKMAEKSLGLTPGALSNPKFLTSTKPSTTMTASIQEYEYAKAQGFKGTFSDYQNEDANRKKSIAAAGVAGFTPAQISSTVNQIAGSFDNEPIVKQFNVINEGYQFVKSLSNTSNNPADDMGLIYAFAKIMDPNSVVREGEYKTVQNYAQSWVQQFGKSVSQAMNGTGFLSSDARTNIKNTLEQRYQASKQNYDNTFKQYQKRIADAEAGKGNSLTDYSQAYTNTGTDSGVDKLKSQLEAGEILVGRENKDGTRHYVAIKPSELWATDIKY